MCGGGTLLVTQAKLFLIKVVRYHTRLGAIEQSYLPLRRNRNFFCYAISVVKNDGLNALLFRESLGRVERVAFVSRMRYRSSVLRLNFPVIGEGDNVNFVGSVVHI